MAWVATGVQMKVRATRLRDPNGMKLGDSPWITPGREYLALAVTVGEHCARVAVITDEGGRVHAWFDLVDFEITDSRPSSMWRIGFRNGELAMAPESWSTPGFWEDVADNADRAFAVGESGPDRDVIDRFDETVRSMMAEAGMAWTGDPSLWEAEESGSH
jgi:hypothetical protein